MINAILGVEDSGGVIPLLLTVSGYAAMERGSEWIELRDLLKAIYIVDLEHVSKFWNDWENFEKLVSSAKLITGHSGAYINRIQYVAKIDRIGEQKEGFTVLGRPSRALQEVVAAARKLVTELKVSPPTPSSRDLLFCICSQDPELSALLQKSGLELDRLRDAVRKPRGSRDVLP